jgi:inosine kinase
VLRIVHSNKRLDSERVHMKFPGRRSKKHYFPVSEKGRAALDEPDREPEGIYVAGIDQLLVDIEIQVTDEFLAEHGFEKGQSFIIDDDLADKLYWEFKHAGQIQGEFPGGAVGNTLHNYAVLSDTPCVALGAINRDIQVGDYAFQYLSKTSALVDMAFLQPSDRPMGRALCFITPDSERTFAISKGSMNDLSPEFIPEKVIANSSALLISAYTIRSVGEPIYDATLKAADIAKENDVPVVFSLGTSTLVEQHKKYLLDFLQTSVSVVAMNQQEAIALTGIEDPLLACESLLEMVDMVLLTVGKKGLYLAGHVDERVKRKTKDELHSKSITEYNKFEYSRAMRKQDCDNPVKIYTHINPFKGGPLVIKNTNGAGDAALSALLHDISANDYHQARVPNSPKHNTRYLTYSSLSQISKYANRVSFEVLIQSSPRLFKGLPEREDSLEEAYWSK